MTVAYDEAIELMKKLGADLAIATDPDCDRLGAVINCGNDDFRLMTGNQSGAVILHYILTRMTEEGSLPENPVMINTVVTSPVGDLVARSFGVEVEKCLTGFKFIGDKIEKHNKAGDKKYVFGYEESYGCLIGDFARDKDAVQASLMICEAAAYYKKQGKTLIDVLEDIFKTLGYYVDAQSSTYFPGVDGNDKMAAILTSYRETPPSEVAGVKVESIDDFLLNPPADFVPSNVLRFNFCDGSFVAVRPSGTEPKCKVYYCIAGKTRAEAEEKLIELKKQHPEAKVLVHPECKGAVVKLADEVGSTAALLNYSAQSSATEFIVVTESGILYEMQKRSPQKTFIPLPPEEGTSPCNECQYMRMITLQKVYNSLQHLAPTIDVPADVATAAVKSIDRMLEISAKLGL